MGDTPICVVDATGIHRPEFSIVIAYYDTKYRGIYGQDIQINSDDQDGELLGLFAQAQDDTNAEAVATYNAYSPATAQGAGLSSNVKINGIKRDVPTASTVPAVVGGVAFTTIQLGIVSDPGGNQWLLPSAVTIPSEGAITVTLTCLTAGAVLLDAGVSLTPVNPTRGWQTVVTSAVATPGAPAEVDAVLRIRQSRSTALPSSTMLDGIEAAVLAVSGVISTATKVYENDKPFPDANGIPGNSIAVVVEGGDAMAIAQAIAGSKFAAGTFGTTSETIVDSIGVSHVINFFFLTQVQITWVVTLSPAANFSTNTIALIQASLAAWTNANGTGANVQLSRAYQAAYLGTSIQAIAAQIQDAQPQDIPALAAQLTTLNLASNTYEITGLAVARDGGMPLSSDVAIAFNESAFIATNPDGTPVNPSSIIVNI